MALLAQSSNAASTSSQHHTWTKKLETSGGTFAGPVVLEPDPGLSRLDDTLQQHQQWMKKLGGPDGILSQPLGAEFGSLDMKSLEQALLPPIYRTVPLAYQNIPLSPPAANAGDL
jgi:hypothetical protein